MPDDRGQINIGPCERCLFIGVLSPQAVKPIDVPIYELGTIDKLPVLDVCMTCIVTPLGRLSENETHQRLPDAEYLVKE